MKTILVLTGGSKTDAAVFDTALAAARPLGAHLEFLHIWVSPGQAAAHTPHVEFAMGGGLRDALDRLRDEAELRSAAALRDFRGFCEREAIEIVDMPCHAKGVSAVWREERDDAVERMMLRARRHDLVVVGRPSRANGLPADLVERLLVGSGRPVLVAPMQARKSITGTVLFGWKETAASARALGAALPLLAKSKRVVIIGVEEPGAPSFDGLRELAQHLEWHGILSEFRWMPDSGSAAQQIEIAAADYDADLLVMGGYSRSRAREVAFGGCTQHFLEHAERPVLMMH
jgi:nucleotide-binding universal stress UspA family protein